MTRDLIIGVESGGPDVVAVAFDRNGREIASASVPGGHDADAAAIRQLCASLPDSHRRIAAVGITALDTAPQSTAGANPTAAPLQARETVGWSTHPSGSDAARALRLDEGIPFVNAPVPRLAAALAAGLFDGTLAGCSIVGVEEAHVSPHGGTSRLEPRATGFETVRVSRSSGVGIAWLVDLARDLLADFGATLSRPDMLGRLDAEILSAPPGSIVLQADDAVDDTGAGRRRAHVFGLSTQHGIKHLMRAAIESFAFAARQAYGPDRPPEIRLAGPVMRSDALRTITASACRMPVRTVAQEWPAAAGAALAAALAIGQENNGIEAAARWVAPRLGVAIHPDPHLSDIYDRLHEPWLAARSASTLVTSSVHALSGPRSVSEAARNGLVA